MRPMPFAPVAAAVGSCLLLGLAGARAGTLASITASSLPGTSTGTIGPIGTPAAPNNDNAVAASPNTVRYSVFFNAPGPVQVEFATESSGGSTEYRFTQSFVNNTGQAWSGFVFELGYGLDAAFTPSVAADGLDFDTPDADPAPTASSFAAVAHHADRMAWSNGSVPSIGVLNLGFSIDVPDNLAAVHPAGVSRFTLRQTPVVAAPVPEPSTLLTGAGGLLALIAARRRARTLQRLAGSSDDAGRSPA